MSTLQRDVAAFIANNMNATQNSETNQSKVANVWLLSLFNGYSGSFIGFSLGIFAGIWIWITAHPEPPFDDGGMGQAGALVVGAPVGAFVGILFGAMLFHIIGKKLRSNS